MSKLNLELIPQHIKDAVERDYPSCTDSKAMAASLGISLSRLQNIAHAMHVPRSLEARSEVSSRAATITRRRWAWL